MFDIGPELRKEMKRSWLIQTLLEPNFNELFNIFSFGGGLINGGFGKEAMNLIRNVCSFDYMGAAEFEWGAVPNTFRFLAEQSIKRNLSVGELTLNKDEVVYYICPKPYEKEVIERIKLLRKGEMQLKCGIGFDRYFEPLKNSGEYYTRRKGWIELDNGFMFFVDKQMYENFKILFGVK
jgi:hypothetical protein